MTNLSQVRMERMRLDWKLSDAEDKLAQEADDFRYLFSTENIMNIVKDKVTSLNNVVYNAVSSFENAVSLFRSVFDKKRRERNLREEVEDEEKKFKEEFVEMEVERFEASCGEES